MEVSLAHFLSYLFPKAYLMATKQESRGAMYLCSQRSDPRISLGQIPKGCAGPGKRWHASPAKSKRGRKISVSGRQRSTFPFRTVYGRRIIWGDQDALRLGQRNVRYTAIFIGWNCCIGAADAGVAGRRLRRHAHPAGCDAQSRSASGASGAGRLIRRGRRCSRYLS